MRVKHVAPAGWPADTVEPGRVQPSHVAGMAHEVELPEALAVGAYSRIINRTGEQWATGANVTADGANLGLVETCSSEMPVGLAPEAGGVWRNMGGSCASGCSTIALRVA